MKKEFYPFENVLQFSKRDIAFQTKEADFHNFIKYPCRFTELVNCAKDRKHFPINRELLVEQLLKQYENYTNINLTLKQIHRLENDDCFTVITAHQPNLFAGPLYFIAKIASTIHLSNKLNTESNIDTVPVFILGGEDHDFEEMQHTTLYGKSLVWETEQSGPVGRFHTEGISELIDSLSSILGNSSYSSTLSKLWRQALEGAKTYAEFIMRFVHSIFGDYGLVIVNMDNGAFKKEFTPHIKKEIFHSYSKPLVEAQQAALSKIGYDSQAHARDINFFYISKEGRNRIIRENDEFQILNTEITFSKETLEAEIDNYPERFSPNVIMRPLYQEYILPNLAYIGGGGELAYWSERKLQFEAANVFFPMLIRRNSLMVMSLSDQKMLEKLNLKYDQLFDATDELIKEYTLENAEHSVNFSPAKVNIQSAFEPILEQADAVDPTLNKKLQAMMTQYLNSLDKVEHKLVKNLKQKQEVQLNQIRKLKNKLFPKNGLQERKVNFMEFYASQGPTVISELVEAANIFEKRFLILFEEK